jgi:hypothetical protein
VSSPIVPLKTMMMLEARIFANTPNVIQAMRDFRVVLQACGWNEREYDRLMLNRVDGGWD